MAPWPDPLQALSSVGPFAALDPRVLGELGDAARTRQLRPGEALHAGDEATELSVVIEGELVVTTGQDDGAAGSELARLGPGSVVGEIALLFGGRRTASVVAAGAAQVVDVSAEGLARLLAAAPDFGLQLVELGAGRLRQAQMASALVRLFGPVPRSALAALVASAPVRPLLAGDRLVAEPGVALVVLSGRVRPLGAASDLGPGEVMGAGQLLLDDAAPPEVRAVRDSEVASVSRDAFDHLAERHPAALRHLARAQMRQVHGTSPSRRADQRTVAVLAADQDVDLRLFTTRVIAALQRHGSTCHLWSARVDSLLHAAGAAQAAPGSVADVRLRHWLHEGEQDHRFVVYELDRDWTAWSQRACRQADEVIVVAKASGEPSRGRLERDVDGLLGAGGGPRRTLVLLHEAGSDTPQDTARWLDGRAVDRHVHLRPGDADVHRLARMLAGVATGLVLGGGGARGLAHLGVIRALRECGVDVDLAAGTSIGATMAAVAAFEWPGDELVPRLERVFSDLLDYTLPVVSLLRGERIQKAIEVSAGGRDIEDLWLPFFCISTNLTRAEEVVHRRGHLATALRASVAIPGVLPPVALDGDLLIDGGCLNNLPVDRMRELVPSGTVVAVDVTPPRGPRSKGTPPVSLSGWRQLGAQVVPGRRPAPLPGITMTMLQATIVAAMRDRNSHVSDGIADLHLAIDARGHGLLDFDALPAIARAGHQAALPQIEAWLTARQETG